MEKKDSKMDVNDSQIIRKKRLSKRYVVMLISVVSIVFVAGIILGSLALFLPKKPYSPLQEYKILQFEDKNALILKLSKDGTSFSSVFNGWRNKGEFTTSKSIDDLDAPSMMELGDVGSSLGSHSQTNVQVEGLDEGDIVKVDDHYIYYLSNSILRIINATDGEMEIVWEKNFLKENFYANELLLLGQRLVIMGNSYAQNTNLKSGSELYYYDYRQSMITIRVYDLDDKTSPHLLTEIKQSGYFNTARLQENYLYYVAQYNFYDYTADNFLPIYKDGVDFPETSIPLSQVYYIEGLPQNTFTTIGRLDIFNLNSHFFNSFIAGAGTVYFSGKNIYLCDVNYYDQYVTNGLVSVRDSSIAERTRIIKIGTKNLTIEAIGEVEGAVQDRYWLDEYQDNLRVASVSGFNKYSNIFIFDKDLLEIGKITNIAPGESIYSVRFTGETGSIVTFERVDPLFKLDLSDPYKPQISKGLKKEGVSFYLHPIEDTHYVIGLGRNSDKDGTLLGLEIVLFDYSDEEATIVGEPIIIGTTYAYSIALYDPKAILYDKEKNVFAFGASIYSNDFYYGVSTHAYYVFGFKDGALELRKEISHFEANINRGVIIGDYLYVLSDSKVTSHLISNDSIGEAKATI